MKRSQGRSHICIGGDQHQLADPLLRCQFRLSRSKSIHADGNVNICFFFLELPDFDLIISRSWSFFVNEAGRFAWLQLMAPMENLHT